MYRMYDTLPEVSQPGELSSETMQVNKNLRYEADEDCPLLTSIGVGFQFVLITLTTMAAVTLIIVQSANQTTGYISWSFFAALAVSGVCTVLQALRLGRFGSAHVLIIGPSPVFISVSITALSDGGPGMLSSLIIVSSLLQFAIGARLAALRSVITPVVSGTVLMLIAAIVMPSLFELMRSGTDSISPYAAPIIAGTTLAVAVVMTLRAPQSWQQWSPLIVIVVGWAIATAFGVSDFGGVAIAPWAGIPDIGAWHKFNFDFGGSFWEMLPGFLVVAVVSSIIAVGNGIAIQQVSRREPRATDFRVVQGALNGEAVCNLLSGVAGTIANTLYPSSVGGVSITGVAAKTAGVCAGLILVVVALSPKALALLLAIPRPVAAAYMVVLFSLIFMQGVKSVTQGGLDARKTIISGIGLWIGVSFHYGWVFPDLLDGAWESLLSNGLTVGSVATILMTLALGLESRRTRRLTAKYDMSALPEINTFLDNYASQAGWSESSAETLRAAGEETLASLLTQEEAPGYGGEQRLTVSARPMNEAIELEFIVTAEGENNIQDRLAYLEDQTELQDDGDISFRLLRHYASSVQHRKYHGIDIVTVQVNDEGDPLTRS